MKNISVIVPVYKAEKTISRCIDSILNQTYKDFELMLIDDGSPDNSGKICDDYAVKDSRVKVIHKQNGGVSSARNCGIKNATKDYICFIDSDDYVDISFLETLVLGLDNSDLAMCSFVGEVNDKNYPYLLKQYNGTIKNSFDNIDRPTLDSLLTTLWNKIYVREIILGNNILFNEKLSFGEDATFVVEYLAKINTVNIIPKCLYHYDQTSENSGVKRLHKNSDECILAMQSAIDDLFFQFALNSKEQQDYKNIFIAERWNYCTKSCLEAILSKKEKIDILKKWQDKIDKDLYNNYLIKTFPSCLIYAGKIKEKSNSIIKGFNKVKRIEFRKKIKQNLKRLIKR